MFHTVYPYYYPSITFADKQVLLVGVGIGMTVSLIVLILMVWLFDGD